MLGLVCSLTIYFAHVRVRGLHYQILPIKRIYNVRPRDSFYGEKETNIAAQGIPQSQAKRHIIQYAT